MERTMNLVSDVESVGHGQHTIAIIAALHGDETEGIDILEKLKPLLTEKELSKHTFYFVIGNPVALQEKKRFVQLDMNRIFPGNKNGNTEEQRAAELCAFLKNMDLVIDIHSTTAQTEPFFIITPDNKQMIPLLQGRSITKLCIMNTSIASGKALIDYCNGFSIEISEAQELENIVNCVIELIKGIKSDNTLEIFDVYKIITQPLTNLNNFEETNVNEETFTPILFGEKEYEFTCLAARKL